MTPTWEELSRLRWAEGDHPGIVIPPGAPHPTVERLREILAPPKPATSTAMRRAPKRAEKNATPPPADAPDS